MNFFIENTNIDEVKIVTSKKWEDERGFFMEIFNTPVFKELEIPGEFVQMNYSSSKKGVVRGLHFQWNPPMGKMMKVIKGSAFFVAVDIRLGSPTFGQWYGNNFYEGDGKQLWAPASFARGFYSLTDHTEIQYLTTGNYNSQNESGILWNDKDIGITWPGEALILSEKDKKAQTLQEWIISPNAKYFKYYDNYS